MADKQSQNNSNPFSWWKIALPIVIGVSVVVLMLVHESSKDNIMAALHNIRFDTRTVSAIILAAIFMVGRDFGLSWRFRELTDRQLSWKKAWKVDLLCEFTSCITPSAVGGSSLGMVFLNTQGIEFGRATTLMITTLFLDELFFVVGCPLAVLFTPGNELFQTTGSGFSDGIRLTFWLVYAALFAYTLVLFIGIIWKPLWIRKVIEKVFKWELLSRWQQQALDLSSNMIATSERLKSKPIKFWLKVFGGTALSWCSRYMVVNALFLGFVTSNLGEQWIVLARQFIIWVVLMVSPTPGGSGLSEWIFTEFYGDLVTSAGLVLILAILWRLISYYVYLIIGTIIVPGWARDAVYKLRNNEQK